MKRVLGSIIKCLARIIGNLIPSKLPRFWSFFKYHLYSGIYQKSFKSCGKNFYLESPAVLHGTEYITVGNNFSSNKRLRLEAFDKYQNQLFTPEIIIGDNVFINYNCHIACINRIIIGNNVLMGSNILITDHYHGEINECAVLRVPSMRDLYSRGSVIIEDNVWIGEGVAIMPGVVVGANSIIGANALVTKSVSPYSVVGGNPAKLLKMLKDDSIR